MNVTVYTFPGANAQQQLAAHARLWRGSRLMTQSPAPVAAVFVFGGPDAVDEPVPQPEALRAALEPHFAGDIARYAGPLPYYCGGQLVLEKLLPPAADAAGPQPTAPRAR